MSQQFTSGKYAESICDRCGLQYKLKQLRLEWTGLKVCRTCWDPKTALEFPSNFPADAEAVRDPRPDNDIEASGGMVVTGSAIGTAFNIPELNITLGEVTVTLV